MSQQAMQLMVNPRMATIVGREFRAVSEIIGLPAELVEESRESAADPVEAQQQQLLATYLVD